MLLLVLAVKLVLAGVAVAQIVRKTRSRMRMLGV